MSTQSVLTSGISNDAGETNVDNSSVGSETEVVGRSTDVISSPRGEISGSIESGKIVDVLSTEQAAAEHTVTSNHPAASGMGNSNNKDKKVAKSDGNTVSVCEEASNGTKQVLVAETDQTPDCLGDSESAPPSSFNTADVSDEKLTEVDNKTTDNDKLTTDVILPGNPGIPDAQNDVTTSGIPREVDSKLELSTSPLTMSVDGVTSTDSNTDVVESLDVGLDSVEEMSVSMTENGSQIKGSSSEICLETEVTCNSEEDAVKSDHVCGQDAADRDRSSTQRNDLSTSADDK